jgi:hypothetical protein
MFSRRRLLTILAVAAVLATVSWRPGSAGAIHELVIEFTVVTGEPFSSVTVATEEVEPWLQGASCAIEVETANNESVHEDTQLIVTSGDHVVTVPDVESEPGIVIIQGGELVLAETVVVAVRLGPDGISSGGYSMHFVCPEAPPTTTTPTTTTTTTTTTTVPVQVLPETQLPPSQPEPAIVAQPSFTG